MSFTFDQKAFLDNFAGMEDLAEKAIRTFIASMPRLSAEIEKAIRAKKRQDLALAAHTLRGALSIFHAISTAKIARQLEMDAEESKLENSLAVFQKLVSELEILAQDLLVLADEIPKPKAA